MLTIMSDQAIFTRSTQLTIESPPTNPLPSEMRLQPSLSSLETWGFGFSGLLLWLGPAPAMHAALGSQAIFVWLPGVIVGTLLNLQVKRLGSRWTEMSGGTPNYTARLLEQYPWLAAYSAIGYFFGWAAVPLVNAIILTDLIQANLSSLGVSCPELVLKIGFTVLAFAVAISGTRALGILHLFFIIPAMGFLITFCVQGIGWLMVSPNSPGFFPIEWIDPHQVVTLSFVEWAKWFFIIVYAVYACETASSFVADSRAPRATLRCLSVTAWLIPVIYLGGSWVLMRLSTESETGENAFLNLLSAATPFWGDSAPLLVTFLIVSSCLLSCATGFSNSPRILYQLALDGYLAPVFGVVSGRGVLGPALFFTLALSIIGVIWGDVSRVVMVTGTGYFGSIMATHLALWLRRGEPGVTGSWLSLGFFVMELVALVVGGIAWGWQDLLVGLLIPVAVLLVDQVIRQIPFSLFQPEWWAHYYREKPYSDKQDLVGFQVSVLLFLVCGTAIAVWWMRSWLEGAPVDVSHNLLIVLLLTIAFVCIAIACWTSLPQVTSLDEARGRAEQLAQELRQTLQLKEALAATATAQAEELEQALRKLQQTQSQLIQTEKMSSLGQLVAGVAHEINNPVNFVHANLQYVQDYAQDLMDLLELYQQHYPEPDPSLQQEISRKDLGFLVTDFPKILRSMKMGTDRIREIVKSLRSFSRLDEAAVKTVNIHEGIDSTLLILQNRIKAKGEKPEITILKEYDDLPLVECYAGQLNQVFMNLLSNAIDALEDTGNKKQWATSNGQKSLSPIAPCPSPTITIRTQSSDRGWVNITIQDNGPGIPAAIQTKLFDPFFTTKPTGRGTGLGLSISYQIITEKHGGQLQCSSTPGEGAKFTITIPVRQTIPILQAS